MSLPEIYDYNGVYNARHPLFVYEACDGPIKTIVWSHAARAVHTAARHVQSTMLADHVHDKSTVVSVLANIDTFTYTALVVGILRAGYRAFPISPHNSAAAVAHLLHKVQSKYLFVSGDQVVQRLAAAATCAQVPIPGLNIHVLPVPSFESLFGGSEALFGPLPPMEHPDETAPALILHSSGSTAFPTAVTLSHRALLQWGLLPYHGDTDICGQIICAHSVPLYHSMGALLLTWAMTSGLIISGFPPRDTPIVATPDRVLSGALATSSTLMFCVPSFIEAWSRNADRVADLKGFRAVIFSGAAVRNDVGERLASEGVKLVTLYGATEVGCVAKFVPNLGSTDDWDYFQFSSHCKPAFVPYQDNIYRLLIVDGPTFTPHIFNTEHDGIKAYDTNDLVVRHPTNPALWRVYGRCDEQLIHSTGEKTNPVPIENMLLRCPKIRGAVVFGSGHFHAGALLDLAAEFSFDPADGDHLASFRAAIWPLVEEVNDRSPTHSRLVRGAIIVSSPCKPFEYTAKEAPRRNVVLNVYRSEIEQVYAHIDGSSWKCVPLPRTWEEDECVEFAGRAVGQVMKDPLKNDEDIFQAGCNSFQATRIRNIIIDALRRCAGISTSRLPQNFVYSNPTVRRLGVYVAQIMRHGQSSVALSASSGKLAEMKGLVMRYSTDFPPHRPAPAGHPTRGGDVVLLTGSTGYLGSHILKELVETPEVRRVYALNRGAAGNGGSVLARQIAGFRSRGLDIRLLDSDKIVLLEGDLMSDSFGLEEDVYCQIQSSITHIIHNAWWVELNVSLSSLEPLIAGTRRLVDFALGSPRADPPCLIFTSSLDIFTNQSGGSTIAESTNARPGTAMGLGYAESKWVAESVLVRAGEQTTLQPVVIRLGCLSGGDDGHWNPADWVPALVRSGQVLRCLPRPDGDVTWIPVNVAAAAIVEMRKSKDAFLNLAHPNPVSSLSIFEAFAEILGVPLVGYAEWFAALEASAAESDMAAVRPGAVARANPARMLSTFYRSLYRPLTGGRVDTEAFGFPTPSIDRALAAAPLLLENLPRLSRADVVSWVRHWRQTGFLTQ